MLEKIILTKIAIFNLDRQKFDFNIILKEDFLFFHFSFSQFLKIKNVEIKTSFQCCQRPLVPLTQKQILNQSWKTLSIFLERGQEFFIVFL